MRNPRNFISALLAALAMAGKALALTGGPVMPEYAQFEQVTADNLVDPSTGNFTYVIPLLELPGPSGGYPLALSYHSGIKHDQEATWVGLGWSLNAGAINRAVRGTPDDYLNAVVTSKFMASASASYVDVSVGYGPVGLSMSFDTKTGEMVGATPSVDVLWAVFQSDRWKRMNLMSSEMNVSLTLSPEGVGGGVGMSGGQGYMTASGNLSVYNSWSNGFDPSYGSGMGVGVGGGNKKHSYGGGLGLSGAGTSVSSEAGKGTTIVNNYPILQINYNGFHFGLSYTTSKWELDETDYDFHNGFLWQNDGTDVSVSPERDVSKYTAYQDENTKKPSSHKYERTRTGEALYQATDEYAISGNGMAGSFQPYLAASTGTYVGKMPGLIDGSAANDEGKKPSNPAGFNDITWRMNGDLGRNLIQDRDGTKFTQINPWYEDIAKLKHYGSYRIEPVMATGKNLIIGFKVTDAEGKVYEYMQPVYNHMNIDLTSEAAETVSSNNSSRTMHDKYATTWLLTAVKGSDYVAINHLPTESPVVPKAGDVGYWVKFSYTTPVNYAWSAPLLGNIVGGSGANYSRSFGIKELVYLASMETATHKAIFNLRERLDGMKTQNKLTSAIKLNSDNLLGELYVKKDPCQELDSKIRFLGNYYKMILAMHQGGRGNEVVLRIRGSSRTSMGVIAGDPNPDITATQLIVGDARIKSPLKYDPVTGTTECTYRWKSGFSNTGICYTYFSTVWLEVGVIHDAMLEIANSGYGKNQLLESIQIFNKRNMSEAIKTIDFKYNYTLSPGTPNSDATSANVIVSTPSAPTPYIAGTVAGGRLTLRTVQITGRGGMTMPPYKFAYQGESGLPPSAGEVPNPAYGDKNKFDIWGMYKPNGTAFSHLTSQGNPMEGVAWNLEKITTPMGGSLLVKYERDSYFLTGSAGEGTSYQTPIPDYLHFEWPRKSGSQEIDLSGYRTITNIPTHTPFNYNTLESFNSPATGPESKKLEMTSVVASDAVPLAVGEYAYIAQEILFKQMGAPMDPLRISRRGFLNVVKVTSISADKKSMTFEPLMIKGPTGKFFVYPSFKSAAGDNFTYKNYIVPVKIKGANRIYGGDVCVRSLTLTDGLGSSYSTQYDYDAVGLLKDGINPCAGCTEQTVFSSGATFGLPPLYSARYTHPYVTAALDNGRTDMSFRYESHPKMSDLYAYWTYPENPFGDGKALTNYYTKLFDYLDAGSRVDGYFYPQAGVLYSRVKATALPSGGGTERIGSTEYQFNGLAHGTLNETPSGGSVPWTGILTTKSGNNIKIELGTATGGIGSVAKLLIRSKSDKMVQKTEYTYGKSQPGYSGLTTKSGTVGDVTQFYTYQIGATTGWIKEQNYATVLLKTSVTTDDLKSETENGMFDAKTGKALATTTSNSDGSALTNLSIPAVWNVAAMEATNEVAKLQESRTYAFAPGDARTLVDSKIVKAEYSNWTKNYVSTVPELTTNKPWLVNWRAVWNPPMNNLGYATVTFQSPAGFSSPDAHWVYTTNNTTFNRFSMPIESADMTHYPRIFYSAIFTGWGSSAVTGTIGNVEFIGAAMFTGDYDTGEDPLYFDKSNHIERGLVAGGVSEISTVEKHFGASSVHVKNAYGPSFNLRKSYVGYDNRAYVLSAWVKPVSGTCQIAFDERDVYNVGIAGTTRATTIAADGNGWRYVEVRHPYGTTAGSGAFGLRGFAGCNGTGEAYFDDIRFHPVDALSKAYFYDPLTLNLIASVDENGKSAGFKYDNLGRLTQRTNSAGKVVSETKYTQFAP